MLNNDSAGQWINGTIGRMKKIEMGGDGEDVIIAELDNGETARIVPYTWKIYRFFLKNDELRSEEVGSFRQYPVRLAFAVTIHKSQEKHLKRSLLTLAGDICSWADVRGTFTLHNAGGLVLKNPLKKSHILMDWQVMKFLTGLQYAKAALNLSVNKRLRCWRRRFKKNRFLKSFI